jgi:DNA-binding IclR family transcriptional regulator
MKTQLTPKQINRTLRQLIRKGFVKQNAQGGYEPTPKGLKYWDRTHGVNSLAE